jgi:hypothetical protein
MAVEELLALTPDQVDIKDSLSLTHAQTQVYTDPARFRVVIAGRRFGKSYLIMHEVIRAAQTRERANILIVGPSLKQTKQIFWRELKNAIPKEMVEYSNETSLEIIIKHWGSMIKLGGADNGDGLRGMAIDMVCMDEIADQPAHVWFEILRPALADRKGQMLACGTPKGLNWVYDLFTYAEANEREWSAHTYTTIQGGNVDEDEIAAARETLSEHQFQQEFEAAFSNPASRVYSNFNRKVNVSREAVDLGGTIYAGIDFNVNPMSAVFMCEAEGDMLFAFDEIEIYGGNTQMLVNEIDKRFKDREIIAYPDPSGRQRKTSAGGNTDFTILGEAGYSIIAPSRTAPVRDRINCTQAVLQNANGEPRLLISPRLKGLTRGLEGLSFDDNGKPDKKSGLDHLCDALGYALMQLKPLRRISQGSARLRGG